MDLEPEDPEGGGDVALCEEVHEISEVGEDDVDGKVADHVLGEFASGVGVGGLVDGDKKEDGVAVGVDHREALGEGVDVAESVLLGGGEFDEPGGAGGDEGRIGGIEPKKVMVAVHHEEDVLFVEGVLTIAGGGVEHDDRAERGLLVVFVLVWRRRWRRGVGRLGRLVLFDAPKGGA
jgi:hypothetical protein